MKKQYARPDLVRYGTLDQLTLGTDTPLPDIDQNGNSVGTGCPTSASGGFTRTSCHVVSGSAAP